MFQTIKKQYSEYPSRITELNQQGKDRDLMNQDQEQQRHHRQHWDLDSSAKLRILSSTRDTDFKPLDDMLDIKILARCENRDLRKVLAKDDVDFSCVKSTMFRQATEGPENCDLVPNQDINDKQDFNSNHFGSKNYPDKLEDLRLKNEKTPKKDILNIGDIVSGRYVVQSKLGQGGYSQVYSVKRLTNQYDTKKPHLMIDGTDCTGRCSNNSTIPFLQLETESQDQRDQGEDEEIYAMKVEPLNFCTQRLKSEASILRKLANHDHFLEYISFDSHHDFSYMIQTMADFDLHEFTKSKNYGGLNSYDTSWLAIGMLESIRDYHNIGYLHRDIKPSNFMIRLSRERQEDYDFHAAVTFPHCSQIILIDFGVSRRFIEPGGGIRLERMQGIPKFRGTNRYCSIKNYQTKELGRVDDLISMYYSLIEIGCVNGLPWRFINNKSETFKVKKRFDYKKYNAKFQDQLAIFLDEFYESLGELKYEDAPDYVHYLKSLTDCLACLQTAHKFEEQ